MFNAISTLYKFQSPQIGNLRTKQAFGSQALPTLNYQIKDVVSFGNKEEETEELKKEGCYDPDRTAITAVPVKNTDDASGIPTEKTIEAMEKAHISIKYETTLEDILDGTNPYSKPRNPSVNILKEVEKAGGNIAKMNEEIQNNIGPYLYKDHCRVFDGDLRGKNNVKFPDWKKQAGLAQMIGESKTAKANPAPWVVILDHLMNDPKKDQFVIQQAAKALCRIGNSPKHLEVFDRCMEENHNNIVTLIQGDYSWAKDNMLKSAEGN